MVDYDWLYTVWLVMLLASLCVRVWDCIIRMLIKYERNRKAVSVDSDDTG